MTSATAHAEFKSGRPHGSLGVLALGALGVVYGDLGTSPLYTEQAIFNQHKEAVHTTLAGVYGGPGAHAFGRKARAQSAGDLRSWR